MTKGAIGPRDSTVPVSYSPYKLPLRGTACVPFPNAKCKVQNAKFRVIARALAPVAISGLNIMQIVTAELRLIY